MGSKMKYRSFASSWCNNSYAWAIFGYFSLTLVFIYGHLMQPCVGFDQQSVLVNLLHIFFIASTLIAVFLFVYVIIMAFVRRMNVSVKTIFLNLLMLFIFYIFFNLSMLTFSFQLQNI